MFVRNGGAQRGYTHSRVRWRTHVKNEGERAMVLHRRHRVPAFWAGVGDAGYEDPLVFHRPQHQTAWMLHYTAILTLSKRIPIMKACRQDMLVTSLLCDLYPDGTAQSWGVVEILNLAGKDWGRVTFPSVLPSPPGKRGPYTKEKPLLSLV